MAINGSVSEGGVDQDDDALLDDPDLAPPTARKRVPTPPKGGRRRITLMVLVVVIVLGVVVAGVLLGSGGSKSKFATFQDPRGGFNLTYPSSWTVTKDTDPTAALLVTLNSDPLDIMQIRVTSIAATVNTSNVADIEAVTNGVISGTRVKSLQPQSVTVDGFPAYYYLYSLPPDPTTGTTLEHSQFFIFPPHEMVDVVFQTEVSRASTYAGTFAQVIRSFQVTRGNGASS